MPIHRHPAAVLALALCLFASAWLGGPQAGATGLAAPVEVRDQEMRFGSLTLAGAGGLTPRLAGGTLITLAPTGRGTAPDDWQILEGHRLAPAADGSLDEGDSIELVANGVVTFTVTARATDDHFTVTGEDESREWRDAWDAARPGQTIGRRGETPIDAIPRISIAVPEGREGGPAPYGMRFEVAGLQGPVAHILRHTEFHWDFEESYAFRRHPRDKRVATDARYARGPWAAHVYRTPGRYTVTLTATFAHGRTASARRTVEISDIDRVFHGRHTIVYSKRGDFSGAPFGAQRFQDLQRAVRAAQAGRSVSGPRARLLLRAGETTSLTDQLALPSLYLGRFGEGPNPIITFDLDAFSENTLLKEDQRKRDASGLTIYGIDFVGHYDAANPAMSPDPSIGVSLGRIRGNFPYITFFDVRISGLASIGRYPTGLIMANSEVTNWYDYGFIGSGRVAFVGNLMHQHPDAKVGPGAKKRNPQGQPNYADHGPMRTSSEDRLILSQNYFFSNTGWSKGGIFEFAHQPAIRTGADRGKPPGTIYVGQNHLHGGFAVYSLGVLKNAPRAAHRPLNIFAGNLVEATPGTRRLAGMVRSDMAARNNIFVFDARDWARYHGTVNGVHVANERGAELPLLMGGIFDFYGNTIAMNAPGDVEIRGPLATSGTPEEANLVNNVVSIRGGRGAPTGPDLDARFAPLSQSTPGPGRRPLIDYYGRSRAERDVPGAVIPLP